MLKQAMCADAAQPYAPRLLADWVRTTPEQMARSVEGSIAFVDISGFTKLSERLARNGKVGAEELTDAIGGCFERLLAVAYDNGGGLIKFGGDALLLLFTGSDHAADACRAAFEMRATLRAMGPLECADTRVTLRMSIGVHTGTFDFFLVGEAHRELVVAGPAATQTVRMEATADAGEIVISPATAARLPTAAVGAVKGDGHLLRRPPPGPRPGRVELAPVADVDLAQCIPVALRETLLGGLVEAEHKAATVAFVHFDGTDALLAQAGTAAAALALEQLVRDVQRAAQRHGVCFLGSDVDDDGGKLILASGVPASTGRDEELMLLALREVVEAERSLQVRAGVNSGHVFAGEIGPPYRRTYTVMGDAVNLAARVMARAAPGQVLATDVVVERSLTPFDGRAIEPFHAKGKAEPVSAVVVGGVQSRAAESGCALPPVVGRERELDALRASLASAAGGRGEVVVLSGDPGIGKSRLVEELVAQARGLRVVRARCQPYEALTPYFAMRQLLRQALGLPDRAVRHDDDGRALLSLLRDRAPELLPWAPLIATVVEAAVPMTAEVERLDAEFRRRRLEQAVGRLLTEVLDMSSLVVVEDAHWMDDPSAELLRQVAREVADRPWLLCLTRRDGAGGFVAPSGPRTTVLRVEPLDRAAVAELVELLSEDEPLAPHDVETVVRRSGGNPLFLAELVAAARAAGSVEGLPTSVEAVISSRIDALPPPDRVLLRRLSVLGPTSEHTLARAVLGEALPEVRDPTWRRLADFIAFDSDKVLRFRSTLVRDGAYESLPFRVRRELHEAVAETLEQRTAKRESAAAVLSLHFFHARRFDKARHYAQTAADLARAAYANVEAADLYQRAVEAAEREERPAAERAELLEALGDVRCRLGEFPLAAESYRLARRLAPDEPVVQARLLLKQGTTRQRVGKYAAAGRWLSRAHRAVEAVPGEAGARMRAQVAVSHASLAKDEGRLSRVVRWSMRCISEAEAAGDKEALARAYSLLDASFAALGRVEEAAYGDLALALYLELDDLWGQGVVLNNLGTKAYWQGDWDLAVALYERSGDAWEQIGDSVNAAIGMANIGEIRSDQGRLDEAQALLRKAQRIWLAAGDRASVAFANSNLGRLAARRGDFDEAVARLEDACAEFAASGARGEMLEPEVRLAEALVLQGRFAEALPRIEQATDHDLGAAGDAYGQHTPLLQRLAGYALLGVGNESAARFCLQTSLEAGRDRGSSYEIALTLRALHRCGFSRDPQALREADELLSRLGVVELFEPDVARAAHALAGAALPSS